MNQIKNQRAYHWLYLTGLLVVALMGRGGVVVHGEETCEDICLHPQMMIPYDECLALTTLYATNGGNDRTNATNRITSPDVASRWGVVLTSGTEQRHVKELILPSNHIVGNLTPALHMLNALTRLDLQDNQILSLPDSLQSRTQLEELIIANNQLSSLPDIFTDRGSLDLLRAEGNQLTRLPLSVGKLYELDLLDLSDNQLTELPSTLGNLDDLDILQVANNRLTILPNPISDLDQLSSLDAQGNQLSVRPAQIEKLTSLESLQLQDNMFTSIPAQLFALPNLHTLSLRNNLISVLPTTGEGSQALHILDLGMNRLTALPPQIASFHGLTQLYLHENRLTELPKAFFALSSLQVAHLAFNLLAGTLPEDFVSLQSLNYLDVSYNSLDHTLGGNVQIPSELTDWTNRPGFTLHGEGQQTQGADRGTIGGGETMPSLTSTAFTRTLELAPGVRMSLDNEQEPTVLISGSGALCSQLEVALALTESGVYQLTLQPQSVGVYEGCLIQLVDKWGELTTPRALPTLTVVTQDQETFCDSPDLTIDRTACLALLQLFVATDGVNWKRSTGWFVDPSVDEWYGIQTIPGTTKQKITGIYLHTSDRQSGNSVVQGAGNGLQGILPNIFTELPDLVTLSLGNNKLSGVLPASLGSLPALEFLYLQNNHFVGSVHNQLAGLTNLRRISLGQNKFTGLLTETFQTQQSLEAVDVRDNSFSGPLPQFASAAPLFYVNGANNEFTGPLPPEWSMYPTLQYIYLQGNILEGTLPLQRSLLTGLKNIDISANALVRAVDNSALLDESLFAWWQGCERKSRENQRDIVAPVISLLAGWTATGSDAHQLRLAIQENNYAVNALNQGMPVTIGGGAGCSELVATDIRLTSGSVAIEVTPPRAGIYENCTLTVLDHGQNYSNTIDLPILGHALGEQSICLHPNLTIPLQECRALRDLYLSTSGDAWTNTNNRRATPQVSNWFGIQTTKKDGQEHVTALLFHRNDLTSVQDALAPQAQGNNVQGSLPESLRDLTKLEHFRIDNNALTGSPRDALVGMESIKTITLANNTFEGILPVHRGGFAQLQRLDLSENLFTGSIPVSWKGLHALHTLNVAHNNLGGPIEVASGDRGSLEFVDFSANGFSGTLDTDRSAQLKLKKFLVANNAFEGTIPTSLSVLTGLSIVDITHNALSGPLSTSLTAWGAIETFLASGNALYGDINTVFPHRTNLKKLNITGNKFTGRLSTAWMQLSKSEELLVARNHLDRTSTHEAITTPSLASWLQQRAVYDSTDQLDTTKPILTSSTRILSPVTHAQPIQLMWEENSYALNTVGSGLQITIGGSAPCTTLLINTGSLGTMTGTSTFWIQPQQPGLHTCWVTLTDHAGNVGRLPLTPFLYDPNCGDGTITPPEQCDEGRFCQDDQGAECTQDISLCPYTCTTTMVDNCTPACKNSVCGDSYVDANGQDNTVGTQDDELCDIGSFCADGRECTSNPSICPGGTGGCMTRFSAGCSPVCAPSSCGDGVIDEDGENNILDDADDEYCDDGNTVAGDGCSSSCKVEYCGDGFLDANGLDQLANTTDDEECDLGAGNGLRAGQCNQFCNINEQTCKRCYETCQGGTGHHSIYLLIDISGSMEGNKLQKAKAGAIEFVTRVMSGASVNTGFVSKIGLIKFSSNGTVVSQPTTNYQQLINAINSLQAGGSTNIGDALDDANTYFANNDSGFVKHVVLLSDGLPTIGNGSLTPEEYSLASAQTLKSGGVKIYTIAVEQTEEGIEFMRTISSSTYMNLNRNKTTSQSSTQSSYSASRAIDADRGNYTQTKSNAQAWWHIDLGTGYAVREVKVWNRSNLTNQTSNFYVLGSATPFTSTNLATTLAQSGVIAQYFTGIAQRPTVFEFDNTIRYLRIQLAGTNRLQLAEVELFGCTGTKDCDRVFSFEDYTSEAISTLYGHIFGSIHCGCGPYQVCGICGDSVIDPTYGEVCDEGSSCNDGRDCSADPSMCPTECRPRTSQTCTQLCKLPSCGDGVVQTGNNEQCDDSNQRVGDGCGSGCMLESCGDGYLDVNGPDQVLGTADDEHCDDGNTVSGDGCSSTCKSEFCGDGLVNTGAGEICDTGRRCDDGTDCTQNPWLCPGQCTTRFKEGCAPDCTHGYCGDLLVDSDGANNSPDDSDDEQCDPGKFCPNGIPCSHDETLCPGACEVSFTPTCTEHCKSTYCGDGYVDLDGVDDDLGTNHDNEQCDDGNGINGDGCSSLCLLETYNGCETEGCTSCGDGTKQFYEQCDPTDQNNELSVNCTDMCTLSVCGDGILFTGEQCDIGKRCDDLSTDCTNDPTQCPTGPTECHTRYLMGCTQTCMLGCGDGTLQPLGVDGILGTEDDEQCDDGNERNTDSCTKQCKRPFCGDGIVTYYAQLPTISGGVEIYYETCDDGNILDGDGCPENCIGGGTPTTGYCSEYISPYDLYNLQKLSFDDVTQFCEKGIPDGSPLYDEQLKEWQWLCYGILGGADSICSLPSWSCGDGVVDVRTDPKSGKTVAEACDDGNGLDGDGCTAGCQFEAPVSFGSAQCTAKNYPTIQPGELLPLWREGSYGNITHDACDQIKDNMIINPEQMICTFAVSRGHPDGYVQQVGSLQAPCFRDLMTLTGGALIYDAIIDQGGDPHQVIGGTYADPSLTQAWATAEGTDIYGQYRLDLVEVTFPYCALTRTNTFGTKEITTAREIHSRTYTSASLCAGTWSIIPGYMMQQQVLFTEQPNTGLELTVTNLSGNSLYLDDSSYDQIENTNTYAGPEKAYLFDQIIDTYYPLATNEFTIATANDPSTTFKKVPNSHVYIYTEQHPLILERQQIEYLLMQAGVTNNKTQTTPFTLIIPDRRAELHLVGDIPGRGMYVARKSITFVAQDCDTNDEVQGFFVTSDQFYSTTTVNTNPGASARCNRGGLTVHGMLLGGDIATTLGHVRRASLNLRDDTNQWYANDGNTSYLADQVYHRCFDIPLLHDTLAKIGGKSTSVMFGGPLSGCSLQTLTQSQSIYQEATEKFFDTILQPTGFLDKAVHEQYTPVANAFLKLLGSGTTVSGPLVTTFVYGNKVYTIQLPTWKMQQITNLDKKLPSFWGSIVDLNDPQIREQFLNRLRGLLGPIDAMMKELVHPLQGGPVSLHQLLEDHFGTGYTQQLLATVQGGNDEVCVSSFQGSDQRLYADQTSCLLTYTPWYRRMIQMIDTYKTQKNTKDQQLLQGAGVQIRSAPLLRQTPPPGARDLLQGMKISF